MPSWAAVIKPVAIDIFNLVPDEYSLEISDDRLRHIVHPKEDIWGGPRFTNQMYFAVSVTVIRTNSEGKFIPIINLDSEIEIELDRGSDESSIHDSDDSSYNDDDSDESYSDESDGSDDSDGSAFDSDSSSDSD